MEGESLKIQPGSPEFSVKLIRVTPDAEQLVAYCARVSNPGNQDNPNIAKLIGYCAEKGHWSIFEQANMNVEITTSRGIAPQILRHRSFSFQEFSQRYAKVNDSVTYRGRLQDSKNRQGSIDALSDIDQAWFANAQRFIWNSAHAVYNEAIDRGIAKECARFLLPAGAETRLYMNGTVRSWIHYLQQRAAPATQKEHRDIAYAIKTIFIEQFPLTSEALGWLDLSATPED